VKAGLSYLPKDSIYPFEGLNLLDPSVQSSPASSPTFDNLVPVKGLVTKRKGLRQIGGTLNGIPMELVNFQAASGSEYLVALTTTRQYYYDTTVGVWVDISNKSNRIKLTATTTGTYTVGEIVTQTTSGATGLFMVEAGGFVYLSYLSGVFNNSDNLTGADSAATSTVSAVMVQPGLGNVIPWTGDESDIINWTVGTGEQGTWLIVTNGKDKPIYWDGANTSFRVLAQHTDWQYPADNFVTCKALSIFYNHLVLVGITDGNEKPFSVVYSNIDSLVDFKNGTSGEALISDSQGPLIQCKPLGDRLIIYSDNSITTMSYVGGEVLWLWETLIQDVRLVSPRGIVNIGPFHLLMRKENISVFDGTRLLRDIGDRVAREYRDILDENNRLKAFAFLDKAKNHVYFAVPRVGSGTLLYLVEYDTLDVQRLAWARQSFTQRLTTMGFYRRDLSLTWNSPVLVGKKWSDVNFEWFQASITKGFPLRVMGFADSKVSVADDTENSDNGGAIDGIYETVDLVSPSEYQSVVCRWLEIELDLRGTDVEVSISLDKGATYKVLEVVDLTSAWTRYRVQLDELSRSLRIRLRNNSPSSYFELRWVRAWFQGGGVE